MSEVVTNVHTGRSNNTLWAFLLAPVIAVTGAMLPEIGLRLIYLEKTWSAALMPLHVWPHLNVIVYFTVFVAGAMPHLTFRLFGYRLPLLAIGLPIALAYLFLPLYMWSALGISPLELLFPSDVSGSSYSAYTDGCQKVIDNQITECGRKHALVYNVAKAIRWAIYGSAFWLIYSGRLQQVLRGPFQRSG